MRFFWLAITTASLVIATYFALEAVLSEDLSTHTLSWETYAHVYSVDREVPYPAVTVCAVQLNDRWNLQRALLNEIEMFAEDSTLNGAFPFGRASKTPAT